MNVERRVIGLHLSHEFDVENVLIDVLFDRRVDQVSSQVRHDFILSFKRDLEKVFFFLLNRQLWLTFDVVVVVDICCWWWYLLLLTVIAVYSFYCCWHLLLLLLLTFVVIVVDIFIAFFPQQTGIYSIPHCQTQQVKRAFKFVNLNETITAWII